MLTATIPPTIVGVPIVFDVAQLESFFRKKGPYLAVLVENGSSGFFSTGLLWRSGWYESCSTITIKPWH